jgi:cobyrinic acid a,c-diamide synthase
MNDAELLCHFLHTCSIRQPDIAVIEGNRGLFDGRDVSGSCSTAHIAKNLSTPVILTINCAKMTRTAAAIVSGMTHFDAELCISGVILNNVAGSRHASMLQKSIEAYTDVPILGILPRLHSNPLPERHLGLALSSADSNTKAVLDKLADLIQQNADSERILMLANSAPSLKENLADSSSKQQTDSEEAHFPSSPKPHIGYVMDDALWFYYEENLQALRDAGAELCALSLLDDKPWPDLDGLYLGGGYPELFAEKISQSPHLKEIRELSQKGCPIYAECGGFMVLCAALQRENSRYPMANIFSAIPQFFRRPQGLGYVTARAVRSNPFHPQDVIWTGHEFHYSRCLWEDSLPECCLQLEPGTGMYQKDGIAYDGLLIRNTFACWTHLYAPAVPHWAPRFTSLARQSISAVSVPNNAPAIPNSRK